MKLTQLSALAEGKSNGQKAIKMISDLEAELDDAYDTIKKAQEKLESQVL